MNHKLMIALSLCFTASIQEVRADAVTDRVLLEVGAGGCPTGQSSFRRLLQYPDGRQASESGEFVVPTGKYLEITSIEYTTPSASSPVVSDISPQSIDLYLRQRSGSAITPLFSAKYQLQSTWGMDGIRLFNLEQWVATGAKTHVAAFPVGPLVSPLGRLCLATSNTKFSSLGGSVRVRGRLIPSGEITIPPGGVLFSH